MSMLIGLVIFFIASLSLPSVFFLVILSSIIEAEYRAMTQTTVELISIVGFLLIWEFRLLRLFFIVITRVPFKLCKIMCSISELNILRLATSFCVNIVSPTIFVSHSSLLPCNLLISLLRLTFLPTSNFFLANYRCSPGSPHKFERGCETYAIFLICFFLYFRLEVFYLVVFLF